MKQSTMNLFLAPWEIEQNMDVFELYNCKDLCSFACTDEKNAHRFVLLPELYDALAEAVEEACQDCVDETYQRTGMLFDPVNDGCIYHERDCCPKCRSWIALLKKIRDYK